MKRISKHPLFPVPKVYVPLVASYITVLSNWIATGTFNRLELAALVLVTGYALIGYATPQK